MMLLLMTSRSAGAKIGEGGIRGAYQEYAMDIVSGALRGLRGWNDVLVICCSRSTRYLEYFLDVRTVESVSGEMIPVEDSRRARFGYISILVYLQV